MSQFRYGALPSPPDNRDYPVGRLLGAAPPPPTEYTRLVGLAEIHNQLSTQSCVCFAIAQALLVFLKARGLPAVWISTLFAYWNARKLHGVENVDNGSYPRDALQVLTDAGCCADTDWPFDPAKVQDQPLPDAYTEAYAQRLITAYYSFLSTGDELVREIKTALSQDHPVIWASPVGQAYEDNRGDVIQTPQTPYLGNHMRCLVGYTADYAIEANSWGTGSWGDQGFGKISWDFIKSPVAYDFWTFTNAPVVP